MPTLKDEISICWPGVKVGPVLFCSKIGGIMSKFILFCFLLISCSKFKMHSITGETMGTSYHIKFVGEQVSENLVKKKVDSFLRDYNNIFSTYIDDSELSRINKAPVNKSLEVSDSMARVLFFAKNIYSRSEGFYDVTVGPLVNRWGFGPIQKKGRPTAKEVNALKVNIGSHLFELENKSLIKKKDIYIDLSSVAKGDGVDLLAKYLEDEFKVKSYFVEIGGEVFAKGKKEDGSSWRVGIERPSSLGSSGIQKIIELDNEAIATSGSYRNFVKYGDSIFSHTIDPKTGYPVNHKLISVSVITDKCAKSDAWATAFMSLGVKKSLELAKKEGLKALFLVKEDDKLVEYKTDNF